MVPHRSPGARWASGVRAVPAGAAGRHGVAAGLTRPSGGSSRRALFGYLFVVLGIVCGLLGGLVAVLADRAGARPARSGRR